MAVQKTNWLLIAMAASLTACGGGSSSGTSSTPGEGQFKLNLTDAPVESADRVVVTFDQVLLKKAAGEDLTFSMSKSANGCAATLLTDNVVASSPVEPCSLDLLELTNGRSAVLIDAALPAGSYTQIRLAVEESASFVDIDGAIHTLSIPSGAQSGLKLVREFTIGATAPTAFTIDFDVRKSLVKQGNGAYKLKPTLRIVETAAAGQISGTVDETAVVSLMCGGADYINEPAGSVYVFAGADATVNDIGTATGPLSSATVAYDTASSTFKFTAAFLPAGGYTLAYTCDADDPEADEELSFSAPVAVSLAAGEQKTVVLDTK